MSLFDTLLYDTTPFSFSFFDTLLAITHVLVYDTKVGVPAINTAYFSSALRNVGGLPPDPSAIGSDHVQSKPVSAHSPASQEDSQAHFKAFVKDVCATLPGDGEDAIQRVGRPRFSGAAVISPSNNNNFDCRLKNLITRFGFMVNQHNYARASKRLWLREPFPAGQSEVFRGWCGRFQRAMEFGNMWYDALRRLDVMFETLRNGMCGHSKGGEVTEEMRRFRYSSPETTAQARFRCATDRLHIRTSSTKAVPF